MKFHWIKLGSWVIMWVNLIASLLNLYIGNVLLGLVLASFSLILLWQLSTYDHLKDWWISKSDER